MFILSLSAIILAAVVGYWIHTAPSPLGERFFISPILTSCSEQSPAAATAAVTSSVWIDPSRPLILNSGLLVGRVTLMPSSFGKVSVIFAAKLSPLAVLSFPGIYISNPPATVYLILTSDTPISWRRILPLASASSHRLPLPQRL